MHRLLGLADNETLIFPGMQPGTLALLALAVVAVTVLAAWMQTGAPPRRARVAAFVLRLLALAVVIAILAAPTVRREKAIPQNSFLVHLFDVSGSMGVADMDRQPRLAAVEKAARGSATRAQLDQIDHPLELTFDASAHEMIGPKLAAGTGPTDLAAALRGVLAQASGLPLGGVVLYSDGNASINNDREAILDAAGAVNAPVYAVGCAPREPAADAWIEDVLHDESAVVGVQAELTALVGTRGLAGQEVEIRVVDDDGHVVQSRHVTPEGTQQILRESFQIRPDKEGVVHCRVEVSAAGESYPWNNARDVVMRVIKKRLRLLYIEGYPRYEYRFLRAAFEKDERFQVISMVYLDSGGAFLRQGLTDPSELLHGIPSKRKELFDYDVIVLGDVPGDRFTTEQLAILRDFVAEKGGGLLMLAGEHSFASDGYGRAPLADALPFRVDRSRRLDGLARVRPTAAGRERHLFGAAGEGERGGDAWTRLPAVDGLYALGGLKPGATVLCETDAAGAQAQPVIAWQRYGHGTALACGNSSSWQWKFQMPSDDATYQAFWKEMALILIEHQGSLVQAECKPSVVNSGSPARLEASARNRDWKPAFDARVSFLVKTPAGKTLRLESQPVPNASDALFQASMTPSEPGVYRVVARAAMKDEATTPTAETLFVVNAKDVELQKVDLNAALLRDVANRSGGAYLHLSDFARLPELIRPRQGELRQVSEQMAWDRPSLLAALIGLLLAEWLIRRLSRMA